MNSLRASSIAWIAVVLTLGCGEGQGPPPRVAASSAASTSRFLVTKASTQDDLAEEGAAPAALSPQADNPKEEGRAQSAVSTLEVLPGADPDEVSRVMGVLTFYGLPLLARHSGIPVLALAIRHERAEVRAAAARGLRLSRSPTSDRTLTALQLAALQDEDARVRSAAASALGAMAARQSGEPEGTLRTLLRLESDGDPVVRFAAEGSLRLIAKEQRKRAGEVSPRLSWRELLVVFGIAWLACALTARRALRPTQASRRSA